MEYPEITQAELYKHLNNIKKTKLLDQMMLKENYTEH